MTKIKNKLTLGLIILFGLMGISTQLNDFEIAKNLEIFSNIYKELNTGYVDEIDPEYLMETGLNAMLQSLDPYTNYIPADEVEQFRSGITGKYGGVGASVIQNKEYVIISAIYENSPAQKAGLLVGDKMLEIDGASVVNSNITDVSNKMRGVTNTEVKIKVLRAGKEQPILLTLQREEIKVDNTPYYGIIGDNIGYIVLNTFSEEAGKHVADALTKLKEKQPIKAVVLDLRGNTGGLLTEAVNVANVFLEKGAMVVQIKGRDKDNQQVFRTLNAPVDTQIPLCVLIDRSSASASEIVAGALQDLDRAVIVGQRSYGKGLVQNTRDLSFGAKVKLTTARYYIPSGRCIQALKYENGKPHQIQDSLRTPYQTVGGRPVYDGGGIKPDVALDNDSWLKIFASLNRDLHLFDYAIAYKMKHATIPAASEFTLTDSDFEDFLKFLKDRGYSYKTETETLLDNLEKNTSTEGYKEIVKEDLKSIKDALYSSRQTELKKQKTQLLLVLQKAIANHYYNEKGSIEAGMKLDADILKAEEILNNSTNYKQILKIK